MGPCKASAVTHSTRLLHVASHMNARQSKVAPAKVGRAGAAVMPTPSEHKEAILYVKKLPLYNIERLVKSSEFQSNRDALYGHSVTEA